jgi:phospholipid-binding lipoprotein MlaA
MRYISIILVILTGFTAGCAHKSAMAPSVAQQTPSSSRDSETPPLPEKQKPSDGKNETREFSDKDLDVLYEEVEAGVVQVADPIAPLNRAMFFFNDKLYFWVLKPVAKGYRYLVPSPVRIGVKNFFFNLITPVRMVNCVLQGKFYSAGTEFKRFVINSTAGVLGFSDPAQNYLQLKAKEEDLGQTFGNYGIGNGFYIVWPFLGPSTLRDTVGMAGDLFLNPVAYVRPTETALGITAYEKVNNTSFHIGDYEAIKEAYIDPYSAVRDSYIQYRKKKTEE